jgi:flavodoxin
MKAFVVYDSFHGNTEDIAIAIGNALKEMMHVGIVRIADLEPELVGGLDFLIIGSPTKAFFANRMVKHFLVGIPQEEFKDMGVLVFDTRSDPKDVESTILTRILKRYGEAAQQMKDILEKRGAKIIADPQGFLVDNVEGPLKEGEEDRAVAWALEAVKKEIR